MRVLQICLKPPVPLKDGGCMAMNAITQGLLNQNIQVKVLSISTTKHPFKEDLMDEEYKQKTQIEHAFIDTNVKPVDAFCNLFTNQSYNIKRFYNEAFKKLIVNTLQKNNYDAVLLESLFVMPYLEDVKQHSKAKIIYRSHNVEYEIWKRNAKQTKGFKKNYIKLLAKRLKAFEIEAINKVDGIAAITEKDKITLQALGCKKPIEVIPFGIDSSQFISKPNTTNNTICHIGSMDWMPNQEGIKWFLKEVWNTVVEQNREAQFNIAGKNMPSWLLNLKQRGVKNYGEVKSAVEFIQNNTIVVVPLFSGSGMRIKIIEAMALGKLVIATGIAAEGVDYTHQKNIIIANTSDEFIAAISYYLANPNEQQKIALAGQQLVQSNYDNQVIVNNLVAFFKQQF